MAEDPRPLTLVEPDGYEAWLAEASPAARRWLEASAFSSTAGAAALLPGPDGEAVAAIAVVDPAEGPFAAAALPAALPEGDYRALAWPDALEAGDLAFGWGLAGYRYRPAKEGEKGPARLLWPEGADRKLVGDTLAATFRIRDLVNTPAGDLGPAELAEAAREIAAGHGAAFETVEGEALESGFPLIHAVGKGSARLPRLIQLAWGKSGPAVTLVGKGVVFDTGGLDIKSGSGMRLMKKDMGGGAHALALAQLVMASGLDVRLRVLVPAVENAISGRSFRPGDVLASRKGPTVEIGNTDAEGRLVLADALTLAGEHPCDLLIDFATLTGAARVALGPEVPAFFSNDEALAADLSAASREAGDPLWRLPLHGPYRKWLESPVADLNNVSEIGFAGSITAALFLKEFVPEGTPWAHFDIYAWNAKPRPGRPVGGEAQALRAVYRVIRDRAAQYPRSKSKV